MSTRNAFHPILAIALVSANAFGCGGGTSKEPLPLIGTSVSKGPTHHPGDTRPVLMPGTWRSEVELQWVVQDKNSSYVDRSRLKLWFELVIAEDRKLVLRVHRETVSPNKLVGQYSRMRGNSTVQGESVSDAWKGALKREGDETRLGVEIPTRDPSEPLRQAFRCAWVRDDAVDYVHCAPVEPYTDTPSKDVMPSYLRTPLVFTQDGRLRAVISGDHRVQSVAIEPQ